MIKRHHSIRYILSRLNVKIFELRNPELPWLTSESIKLLSQLILPGDIGLEFGSGRSTKWLASRCNKLTSVENNKFWFEKVKNELGEYKNVDYFHKEIDRSNLAASEYLKIFDKVDDESVDFVLDDGKIRDLVALKSIAKLKIGGLLILDNAERYMPNSFKIPESIGMETSDGNWNSFLDQTKNWRRVWANNGVTSTLILIKR